MFLFRVAKLKHGQHLVISNISKTIYELCKLEQCLGIFSKDNETLLGQLKFEKPERFVRDGFFGNESQRHAYKTKEEKS